LLATNGDVSVEDATREVDLPGKSVAI
jgi:hypothetical protein